MRFRNSEIVRAISVIFQYCTIAITGIRVFGVPIDGAIVVKLSYISFAVVVLVLQRISY